MDLTLTDLVVAVVFGSMGLVLVFAMISSTHRRQSRSRGVSRTVVCRLCLHAYQLQDRSRITECPECGARNERGYHLGPR